MWPDRRRNNITTPFEVLDYDTTLGPGRWMILQWNLYDKTEKPGVKGVDIWLLTSI